MVVRIVIFLFALAAAGGAAMMSLDLTAQRETEIVEVPREIAMKDVLVAATPFTGGEVLSPDRVRWQPWPENTLTESYITRDQRPEAVAELSGSFVNRAFAAGEPIRAERLMQTNLNLLSNKIAPGRRAAAVKISAERTAGGFILPGDRVDVIHTVTRPVGQNREMVSESDIMIENVRVLAIDQTAVQSPEGTVVGQTATLELWPDQVSLVMSGEASGTLTLALRAVTDHATDQGSEPGQEQRDGQPQVGLDPGEEEERTVTVYRGVNIETVTLN